MKSKLMHKRKLVLGGLLTILVFSSFLYLPVSADDDDDEIDDDDEDDDGIDDDDELRNERELDIEVEDYEIEIKSKLKVGDVKNEIEIEIETEHEEDDDEDYGLEFKFKFKHDSEEVESKLKFKIVITDIHEFRDLNSDGIYDAAVDELIQTYKLDSFLPFYYTIEDVSGTNIYTIFAVTTDGVFNASIYMVGEFALVDDTLVSPTEIKFDIGIFNFNYLELDSQLAMKVMLKDKIEYEDEDDDDDDTDDEEIEVDEETEDEEEGRATDEIGIQFMDVDFTGFFTWFEFATIDGVIQDIQVSPVKNNGDDNWLYLNYPRGDIIIHDPKIGVEGALDLGWSFLGSGLWVELPGLSQNELLIVSAITFLAITGLVLVFRRRRKV